MAPLYPRILGGEWTRLPEGVRCYHAGLGEIRAFGRFEVRWGERPLARTLARLGGLPGAGEQVPTELQVTPDADGETWRRRFGSDFLATRQWEENGRLMERAGRFELSFRLEVSNSELVFEQTGAWLRLGPARLPIPRWLAPRVRARAGPAEGAEGMQVRVEVSLPGVGILCSYRGSLLRSDLPV